MDFPIILDLQLGEMVKKYILYLTTEHAEGFSIVKKGVLNFLLNLQDGMLAIPWYFYILLVFLAGWRLKSWKSGLGYGFMIFLIGNLGYWEETILTLAIVLASVIISLFIGIPLGILSAYKERVEKVVRPILDAMQTMPSFVYLIPAIMLFGLGNVPAVFATTIYALPPVIRLTTLAIKSVSSEMIEAANSFGASFWQILFKVELPQAVPTIMAGVNQTTMMAMAMVVVSSMIGAKGLGYSVLVAINRTDIAMGFESGMSIVLLAIVIDRLTQAVANKYRYN